MKHVYETSFTSEIYNVKSAIKAILRFLQDNAPFFQEDCLRDLRLIFSELLCNAVIHGNKQDINKNVHVKVEVAGDTVNASVTDEGAGFDYVSLLVKASSIRNYESESGRGIFLVYSLTDSLSFNMRGNQIRFIKRMNADG